MNIHILVRLWFICTVIPLLAAGCQPSSGQQASTMLTADHILHEMIAAYQKADSYADQGTIVGYYDTDGQQGQVSAPLSVQFIRPNRFNLKAYQVHVTSNGEWLMSRILDQEIPELASQVVQRPAPESLTMADIRSDRLVRDLLDGGAGGEPIQLRLLIEKEPLAEVFDMSILRELLDSKKVDGRNCHRVQIGTASGNLVMWIDAESHELRRLEYPPGENDRVTAEFRNARLGVSVGPAAFDIPLPKDPKTMRHFVIPPQPLPSNLYGKTADPFSLGGSAAVSQESLREQIAVLVWFNNHPACRATLERLERIYERYQNDRRIVFRAVWAEGSNIGEPQLQRLLEEWGVSIPVVRDLEAYGSTVFRIPAAPALVVLNPQSTVQIFQVVRYPEWLERFPNLLDRLLEGADLASETLRRQEQEWQTYHQQLAAASGEAPTTVIDIPEVQIAAKSEPQRMQLALRWTCSELSQPGNIHVFEETDGKAKILVHDGTREIAEIDRDGKVATHHDLRLADDQPITYLRSATDSHENRYYVGAANLARQLFVFDENWKLLIHYPDEQQQHEGIRDVQIADITGNGYLDLAVGFWGLVGLQAVDLDGSRHWSQRSVTPVLSIALTGPDELQRNSLLATGDRGTIVPVDSAGRREAEIQVGTRSIYHLERVPVAAESRAPYCAMAYTPDGDHLAVALDEDFQEQWSYPLPNDVHRSPIRQIVPARLLGDNSWQWLFPTANGSIHILTDDGEFHDQFSYGESLRGLAATRWNDEAVLLIATEKEVTAWTVVVQTE